MASEIQFRKETPAFYKGELTTFVSERKVNKILVNTEGMNCGKRKIVSLFVLTH